MALPPRWRRGKGGDADGDDFLEALGFDFLDGVAGIDRPAEDIGRFDGENFGDLRHVEPGRDARQDVLAVGGGRREDRVIGRGARQHELRHGFGEEIRVARIVGQEHCFDAGEL